MDRMPLIAMFRDQEEHAKRPPPPDKVAQAMELARLWELRQQKHDFAPGQIIQQKEAFAHVTLDRIVVYVRPLDPEKDVHLEAAHFAKRDAYLTAGDTEFVVVMGYNFEDGDIFYVVMPRSHLEPLAPEIAAGVKAAHRAG
jgi:hypothetical protein